MFLVASSVDQVEVRFRHRRTYVDHDC